MTITNLDTNLELSSYINENYAQEDLNAFECFSSQLFNSLLSDDMQMLSTIERYRIALSLWQSFSCRAQNENKVVIKNSSQQGLLTEVSILHIITDDKAFLVGSLSELLITQGYKIDLFLHPVINRGQINDLKTEAEVSQFGDESVLYIELANQLDPLAIGTLVEKIQLLLSQITKVITDWPLMTAISQKVNHLHNPLANIDETESFLSWLCHDNFVFLGYRSFILNEQNDYPLGQSNYGIFRNSEGSATLNNEELTFSGTEFPCFIDAKSSLMVSKSNLKSTIYRSDYLDLINVKEFSAKGEVIIVHQFIGLFTQIANNLTPKKIPFLRYKLEQVIKPFSVKEDSHNYRNFVHILASLPKRELYESSIEHLIVLAKGIHNLNVKSKSGTFIRESDYNNQVSVLVFVSKDAFCTDLRDEIENELSKAYQGKILLRRSMLNDNYLAQWHFIVQKSDPLLNVPNIDELIACIEAKTQSWAESLHKLMPQLWDNKAAIQLFEKYKNGFSKSYREQFSAKQAISAILNLEKLDENSPFQFQIDSPLSGQKSGQKNTLVLNIYTFEHGIALSDSIPILENFDFRPIDEFSFKVDVKNKNLTINNLYSYTLEYPNSELNIETIKVKLEQALSQVWLGNIENDGYNKLLISANVNIRQIVIIRAYGKYLRQLGLGYSEEYFQQALINYPDIVNRLIGLFETRFALTDKNITERNMAADKLKNELLQCLSTVNKIDHDRILRNFIAAISATVRVNFYQKTGSGELKTYCSFKIHCGEIDDAPQPKPYVETFVYSPRVEGVHLRFGLVSRGGLRWSDRREDFRTEVLGLVKAQQVKNVVIVPQGAKGGFVPKNLPLNGSREAITKEAIACYKIFISALLDLTDNNGSKGIVKPKDIVCFDGDDSYLVVAADKGTATFSDIANGLADDYGFWLGDAFASGGSIGYDHKKMGITAKGAWVSVQRHFREMNIDVQKDEISVIGIGDMSGDVFGNGMLSSKTIKLVAAFDHRDIFIDPDPDTGLSFVERKRLYQLERSSWEDYDKKLISVGGGVFSRSMKHIELTTEIKQLLDIDSDINTLSPDQLIRNILTSQAQLLWFGGIGTYVKANNEINIDVGDKSNDALRVNGNDLRCKVIGEGGNLGCTQLARIEFSKGGGKINTDAVDNSAGVNCSDNEVNIKILLNGLVDSKKMTKAERDTLLEQMTDEVGVMVLRNNYYQAQALSIDEFNSQFHFDSFTRLTQYLVNSAQLNRELEYLPDDEELQARNIAQQGLTRPELAVLMAYSKMDVHNALLQEQALITDNYFEKYLLSAFPDVLAQRYSQEIINHPLARQIIATSVANEIFNRGGIHAVREQTGATIAEIVKAFIIAKEVFSLDEVWYDIESLGDTVSAKIQIKMMIEVQRFYRLMAIWFINHSNSDESIKSIVQRYSPGISTLQQLNDEEITLPFTPVDESLYQLESEVGGLDIVDKIHQLKVSSVVFCDIVKTAFELNLSVDNILPCYCQVSKLLSLDWLIEQTEKVQTKDHWSRLARFSLLLDLLEFREKLIVAIVNSNPEILPAEAIKIWAESKFSALNRVKRVIDDLKASGRVNIDKLYFANRQIRSLLS